MDCGAISGAGACPQLEAAGVAGMCGCSCGGEGEEPGECEDIAGWTDSEGDGCALYEAEEWCSIAEAYADEDGVTALDACCYCGGGSD